jgi:two-component system NtrC family sensor kinase
MPRSTILVIDDDKHQVEVIQQYLEAQGHVVFTAFDGIHAHPMAKSRRPSLLIMDVDMPMVTGLQALELLRADEATREIPIIFLTGVTSETIFPVIQNMPRVTHIKKPLNLEDLGSMVRHYIPE